MYSYFSTEPFVKLLLLINLYFLGMSLHYPIFLLFLLHITSERIYREQQPDLGNTYNFQVMWSDFSIPQFSIFLG